MKASIKDDFENKEFVFRVTMLHQENNITKFNTKAKSGFKNKG